MVNEADLSESFPSVVCWCVVLHRADFLSPGVLNIICKVLHGTRISDVSRDFWSYDLIQFGIINAGLCCGCRPDFFKISRRKCQFLQRC